MVDLPLLLVAMLLHGTSPELVDLLPHHGNNPELAVLLLLHGLHLVLTAMGHLLVEMHHQLVRVLPGNQADTTHTKHKDITMAMDLTDTMTPLKHHRQAALHLGSNNSLLPLLHLHHRIRASING